MSEHNDAVLREWAETYAEGYGAALLQEQAEMQRQNLRYALPHADARVKELAKGRKKRSKTPYLATAAAAACLLLFIGSFAALSSLNDALLPSSETAMNPQGESTSQGETDAAQDLATPDAVAPDGSTPGAAPDESATNAAAPDRPAPSAAPSEESPPRLRPLSFNLPLRFSIASAEVDKGQSIYRLNDSLHDDVVLTMESPIGADKGFLAMDSVLIDGRVVSAEIRDEYKLLRFEEDGALYTISCRDDLGTLSELYRSIVDPANKKA